MIDWHQVKVLHGEIGAAAFDDVAEMFLRDGQETITRLRRRPDPDTLEEELHTLKGSALTLGFRDFALLCQVAEARAAEGMAQQVDLAKIAARFNQSRHQFKEGLARALTP